jgi:hypothetical protein
MLQALIPGTTTYFAQANEIRDGYPQDWGTSGVAICGHNLPELELQVVQRSGDSRPTSRCRREGAWVNDAQQPARPARK